MLRKIGLLAAIVALVLMTAAAAALAASQSGNNSGKGNFANHKDFAGLVDIGGGAAATMRSAGEGATPAGVASGGGGRAGEQGLDSDTHQ